MLTIIKNCLGCCYGNLQYWEISIIHFTLYIIIGNVSKINAVETWDMRAFITLMDYNCRINKSEVWNGLLGHRMPDKLFCTSYENGSL